jgi:hypothetical protein
VATLILDAEYSHTILISLHPVFAYIPIIPTLTFFFMLLHSFHDHMLSKRINHPPLTHIIYRPLYIESSHCSVINHPLCCSSKEYNQYSITNIGKKTLNRAVF